MLIDTGVRLSELTGLCIGDLFLEEGFASVMGKGQRQGLVPLGKQLMEYLWRYNSSYRPKPLLPEDDRVFLTEKGQPLRKNRVEFIVKHYGMKVVLKRSGFHRIHFAILRRSLYYVVEVMCLPCSACWDTALSR